MQQVILNEQKIEDELTVNNMAKAIKSDAPSFVSVVKDDSFAECNKVVRHTTMAMQTFASAGLKTVHGLEVRDVEQIKDALRNFRCDDVRAKQIKEEIINDLTEFQKFINTNHVNIIAENLKQKQFCERQIRVLEVEKSKLIMERLSKIAWPYDAKTKEFDNKIAALESKIQQHDQKILAAKQNRPMANEKDILIYGTKLQDKYLKSA